jgi:alkaline phosphatase D
MRKTLFFLSMLALLVACSSEVQTAQPVPQAPQVGGAATAPVEDSQETSAAAADDVPSDVGEPIGEEPASPSPAGAAQDGGVVAVTHGPISGEGTDTSAVLWARSGTAGTLNFEASDTPDFSGEVKSASIEVDASTDFTGEIRIEGLTPGQFYAYRVTLAADGATSDPVLGSFQTAPAGDAPEAFDFVFGSCIGGQGYCRDPETGWVIFDAMLAQEPDFFVLLGDSIYADTACSSPDNLPGAEGPYTDLAGFRTRYRYTLEDSHYASFLANVPVYVTWDDHEVVNDFGGPALSAINPDLFQEGRLAFFEYWPLTGTEDDPYRMYRSFSYGAHADFFILDTRSYRDPNVNWDPNPNSLEPKTMLGAEQFAWLQESLDASEATWKFVVSSVPLSYPTGWPQPEVDGRDGWANYSERSGYETELTALVTFIESHDVGNLVFLTADVHWPHAISYDPDRDGAPNFHEFGSSPISAIPLSPPDGPPDLTFNPTVLYAEGEFAGDLFNFGRVSVSEDGNLTFQVMDWQGTEHYSLTLTPE